jgi:hypothetical protein
VTREVRVAAESDDAEQDDSGNVAIDSSDLELTYDDSAQIVGIRFTGVNVPRNATIQNAYIQFQVDETTTNTTPVTIAIRGQAIGNAPTFNENDNNLSSRPTLSAVVSWSPPTWPTSGVAGTAQRTSNLAPILQQIVSQGSWNPNQAMAFILTGTSASKAQSRIAEAFDGDEEAAPLLHVEYR